MKTRSDCAAKSTRLIPIPPNHQELRLSIYLNRHQPQAWTLSPIHFRITDAFHCTALIIISMPFILFKKGNVRRRSDRSGWSSTCSPRRRMRRRTSTPPTPARPPPPPPPRRRVSRRHLQPRRECCANGASSARLRRRRRRQQRRSDGAQPRRRRLRP